MDKAQESGSCITRVRIAQGVFNNIRKVSTVKTKINIFIVFILILGLCYAFDSHAADYKISSCQITSDKKIHIVANMPADAGLYVMQVSQDITQGVLLPYTINGTTYITDLYYNGQSLLSCQFAFGCKTDNGRIQLGNSFYITNPEVLSQNAPARKDNGIKGLLPASTNAEEYKTLGVKQLMFNIEIGTLLGKSSGKNTIEWHKDGQVFYFKTSALEQFDRFSKWCEENGFQLNMTLLNAESSRNTNLIHPDASDGTKCPTYAFNTGTDDGVTALKAVASFLATRYSGGEYGTIDNWFIGNQVNCRTEWYYHSSTDLDINVQEYIKAYRIFYNEIKSVNKNADVYISLDQEWNERSNQGCFLSREYLSRFAYWMTRGGNIDYAVSIHPYNAPLYDPYAYLPQEAYVWQTEDSPYLTMSNIELFIDEMKKEQYLSPSGTIRHLMISEVGYSSSISEEAQAASVAYAYTRAASFPEIKGFILFRDIDNEYEVSQGLANGLKRADGSAKLAYQFYQAIGTPAWSQYDTLYKQITGYTLQDSVKHQYSRTGWEIEEETENDT